MNHLPHTPDEQHEHDDFGGLRRDLPGLVGRRRVLALIGGASLAGVLAACSRTSPSATTATSANSMPSSTATASSVNSSVPATTATSAVSAGAEIPDETAGPYPADGSNGPNFLAEDGIVRADITSSVGSFSGTADGIPATISLTVVDNETGAPIPGAAVYLWHCTAGGQYSIYEIADQNYLRGVQVADDRGVITFETVYAGCYRGRWPHAHFEVYDDLGVATSGSAARKTSQLAFPQSVCETVYTDARYGDSLSNLGQLSLTTDNIFADGWEDQLADVTGSNDAGYLVSLLVRI